MKRNGFVWVLTGTRVRARWNLDPRGIGFGFGLVALSSDKGFIFRCLRNMKPTDGIVWHVTRVRAGSIASAVRGSHSSTMHITKLIQPSVGKGGFCFQRRNGLEWK